MLLGAAAPFVHSDPRGALAAWLQAHDVNDYAIGKRHSLPMLNILNKDATLNAAGGAYEGLDRYACREKLWADMEAEGLTIKVEKHSQRVPRSQVKTPATAQPPVFGHAPARGWAQGVACSHRLRRF